MAETDDEETERGSIEKKSDRSGMGMNSKINEVIIAFGSRVMSPLRWFRRGLIDRNRRARQSGYIRLEGELTGYRAEFESLADEAATDGESGGWVERGETLLCKAQRALNNGKIEQGWHYLHAAKRLETYGLDDLEDQDALQARARELLDAATDDTESQRLKTVRNLLTDEGGNLKEVVTVSEVRSATALMHEYHQRTHLKRQHLQSQFTNLRLWAVTTVVAFLVAAVVGDLTGGLHSPFVEFSTNGTVNSSIGPAPGATSDAPVPASFLIYIVLAGMLGASLFGLRSLRQLSGSASTPQYITGFEAAMARIAIGAGSALAIVFFLRSGLFAIASEPVANQGPFLIAIAFVAGYSQRLVHATIDSVASMTVSETSNDVGS